MARYPKQRSFVRPTHRDKYPIRDSKYFLDKSITKCVFCFEPAFEKFQGLDCCIKCLEDRTNKGQFSHKIYKEIEDIIQKIKGTQEKVKNKYGTGKKIKQKIKTGKKVKEKVLNFDTKKWEMKEVDEKKEVEVDEFIEKEETKYPVELVIACIKNKPKAIFQYYMVKDNSMTKNCQDRLRAADKALKDLMNSDSIDSETLKKISENCAEELQIIQNKVSVLI